MTELHFLFKNFIALWRHLAKTQLLCVAQIYLYSVNKQIVNDCVQHIILQKFTKFPYNSVTEFSE